MCPQSSSLSITCAGNGIRQTQQLAPGPWPWLHHASRARTHACDPAQGTTRGSLRLSATDMPCRACVHAARRPSSHPSLRYTVCAPAREYLLSLDHFTPFHDCSMCPYLLLARGNVRFHVHSVVYIYMCYVLCATCAYSQHACAATRYKVL